MGREESEPIEPTPETDPFAYLVTLLQGKRARFIETRDFNVGLMLEGRRRNPSAIEIHVFTEPKEFFGIARTSEILVAIPQIPSVTGISGEELFDLENHTIGTADIHNKQRMNALSDIAEQVREVAGDEEMRKTIRKERAISVKLAKFVEGCIKESKS